MGEGGKSGPIPEFGGTRGQEVRIRGGKVCSIAFRGGVGHAPICGLLQMFLFPFKRAFSPRL